MSNEKSLTRMEIVNLRLLKLGIREDDLTETFIRSGGKGGQNVNKVSTAVRLKHIPTGTYVKCMEARSQYLNRVRVREIFAEQLEEKKKKKRLAARAEYEKIRKQKAGRPKSIKKQILKDKRKKSMVKKNRSWKAGSDPDSW